MVGKQLETLYISMASNPSTALQYLMYQEYSERKARKIGLFWLYCSHEYYCVIGHGTPISCKFLGLGLDLPSYVFLLASPSSCMVRCTS